MSSYIKVPGVRPQFAKFFLIGSLMNSSIDSKGSKFHVAPIDFMWPRVVSLFGNLAKTRSLFIGSYFKGLTFGTKVAFSVQDKTAYESTSAVPVKNRSVGALEADQTGMCLKVLCSIAYFK
jgi:hypothetical protein